MNRYRLLSLLFLAWLGLLAGFPVRAEEGVAENVAAPVPAVPALPQRIDLGTAGAVAWEFRQEGQEQWLPATVPGCVHTDLLKNEKIPDPFWRTNERLLQWIDKVEWEYHCEFEVTPEMLRWRQLDLCFDGLDTVAEVWLNGKCIQKTDNMFRRWRIPCRGRLTEGKNQLYLRFRSPLLEGLKRQSAYGLVLPADNDTSQGRDLGGSGYIAASPFIRKAPYQFGWDWGPRLTTSGIWRPVYLEGYEARLIDVGVATRAATAERATLDVSWDVLAADQPGPLQVELLLDGQRLAMGTPGDQAATINVDKPRLWWSRGLGEQNLYTLTARLWREGELLDERQVPFGIRTLRLVRKPDGDGQGESFYFELNGVPVFAKGANYIPSDIFPSRMTADEYKRVVGLAAAANMNMLRIWGGGIYEDDEFYHQCDRQGIMIWHDFMFACSMYPGDSAFLANVAAEAEDNLKRLRNHPCIALWCGNNEIETAWGQYEEKRGWGWKQRFSLGERGLLWNAYESLFHKLLPDQVRAWSPQTSYWHSSPSAGEGMLSTNTTRSGDIHYWGVWFDRHPFEMFRKNYGRFMSEYGFQSFPEMETVALFAANEDLDLLSEVMRAHQKSFIGNAAIRDYMTPRYQTPKDFASFVYVGQLLQAMGIKTAIEAHRTRMPYCMGSLYWQLNDCWPGPSWSSTDSQRRWKALHYAARDAFAPVIVTLEEENNLLSVSIVSDRLQVGQGTLALRMVSLTGKPVWQKEMAVEIPANRSNLAIRLDLGNLRADRRQLVLLAELRENGQALARNLHYFVVPKELALPAPGLQWQVAEIPDGYAITFTARNLAKNVYVRAKQGTGQFSDNFFDLLPGETKTIVYTGGKADDFVRRLEIRTLVDTYAPGGSR